MIYLPCSVAKSCARREALLCPIAQSSIVSRITAVSYLYLALCSDDDDLAICGGLCISMDLIALTLARRGGETRLGHIPLDQLCFTRDLQITHVAGTVRELRYSSLCLKVQIRAAL